jgi:hypothetical protein
MTAGVIRYPPRLNQFGERVRRGQIEEEFVNFVRDGLRLHQAVAGLRRDTSVPSHFFSCLRRGAAVKICLVRNQRAAVASA